MGSSLTQFVLVWWITQKTGSANSLAIASMMAMLPVAVFSPLGGVIADRLSRRLVMICADAITAICMVVLIILFRTGNVQLWQIYTLMFIRASMQSFQHPAVAASTANLVPTNWLERVAGMNQALQGVMTIAAAPLGALALAFLPTEGALMIDVVTALLGISPLFFYHIPQPKRADQEKPASVFTDMREGASYIIHRRGFLPLYAVTGLVVLTIMPTFALTPLLVTQHFNGGVNDVAIMEGLAGVGIILGGLIIGVFKLPAKRVYIIMISFAISCGTVALTALAPANMFWLAVFWWFVSGVSFSTGNGPMVAVLQKLIPNEIQGRALSLLSMVFGLAGPLGLAIAGPLGEAYGVRVVFIAGGTLSALINLIALASRPLREIENQEE